MNSLQTDRKTVIKKARIQAKRNLSGWILMFVPLLLFIMIVWRPLLMGISYSFFKLKGFTPTEFVGLQNFIDVITDTDFPQTLMNTVKYVVWSLVIGMPLPFLVAVMLNEMIHGKNFFRFTMYIPVIVPIIATSLIWKEIYLGGSGGLLNIALSYFGITPVDWLSNKNLVIPLIIVSMTWHGFGGTVIMYLATMQSINQELYEAARLDGAGLLTCVRHVMMPHMGGTVLLLAIKQIISVFSVTEQPLVMTGGGPNGASMSLGLTNYFYAFKYGQFEKSMALGVISFMFMLILTFIYFQVDKKLSD
ncbi:MAG: sugar ABC transporter permease [Clostridia bacterium]|nr:sugar ABC transporter permease [Oscillospiraceae bacterium]MDY3304020.1 sugar ABC transporter permease [Clostridia bacterium]MDY5627660.1 sugar ABC transporter permease [Clostridia bacterium]